MLFGSSPDLISVTDLVSLEVKRLLPLVPSYYHSGDGRLNRGKRCFRCPI